MSFLASTIGNAASNAASTAGSSAASNAVGSAAGSAASGAASSGLSAAGSNIGTAASPSFSFSGLAKDFGQDITNKYAGGITSGIDKLKAGDYYGGIKDIYRQADANSQPNPYTRMPELAPLSQMPTSYIPSGLDKYRRRY